jgi:hypothetical protein
VEKLSTTTTCSAWSIQAARFSTCPGRYFIEFLVGITTPIGNMKKLCIPRSSRQPFFDGKIDARFKPVFLGKYAE